MAEWHRARPPSGHPPSGRGSSAGCRTVRHRPDCHGGGQLDASAGGPSRRAAGTPHRQQLDCALPSGRINLAGLMTVPGSPEELYRSPPSVMFQTCIRPYRGHRQIGVEPR